MEGHIYKSNHPFAIRFYNNIDDVDWLLNHLLNKFEIPIHFESFSLYGGELNPYRIDLFIDKDPSVDAKAFSFHLQLDGSYKFGNSNIKN